MSDFTRCFDLLPRQLDATVCLAGRAGTGSAAPWRTCSSGECTAAVDRYSHALLAHGIRRGDRVALFGTNCPEWIFADFAVQQIGAVTVPVLPAVSDQDLRSILDATAARLCFATGDRLLDRVRAQRQSLRHLEATYSLTSPDGSDSWPARVAAMPHGDADALERARAAVSPDDVATIIFTSGTTGAPKGVVLTHRNVVSNVRAIAEAIPLPAGSRALSFLPLGHSFERLVVLGYMVFGVAIYLLDDLADLPVAFGEVKPHYFTAVPRLLEKQYEALLARGQRLHGLRRRVFDRAIAIGRAGDDVEALPVKHRALLWIADRTIFARWREALGGRVRMILSGGARLDPALGRLFAAAGLTVIEGYGLTETSTFVTSNRPGRGGHRPGTVGRPVPGVDVRISEDGEILVRGPNVMTGYLDRPDLTAETIDRDGWLHTGDLGTIDADGFLTIDGRKKDLFKLSTGEYVAPEAIEAHYRRSPFIEQIMVVGEGRKYVAALIVPSFAALAEWYASQRLAVPSPEAMIQDPRTRTRFADVLREVGRDLGRIGEVKRCELLAHEWSVQNGALSPTLKLRRKVIAERYATEIARCYDPLRDPDAPPSPPPRSGASGTP